MFEDGVPGDLELSSLDGGARVDALCAIARTVAGDQARLLEAMAAVAGTAAGIGFDADEVAFALCLPRVSAQHQVALAVDLTGRLPQVLAALRAGRICLGRARVFSEVLAPVGDVLARELADRFLPPAEVWTASQLRSRLLKAMLDADPSAAKTRFERSVAERRVSLSHNDDTTACLSGIFLPPVKAAAAFERVDAIARGLKRDGEARTLEQLRADVYCDLLAGVSPASGPIVRAGAVELLVPLATLAGLSEASGSLAGYGPVMADIARQVAAAHARQAGQVGQAAQDGRAAQVGQAVQAGEAAQDGESAQAARARGDGRLAESGQADCDGYAVGGAAATQVDRAVAAAAGGVVAPQPAVQWRYRVHDDDGTLLFHGITRARPTSRRASDAMPPPNSVSAGTGGMSCTQPAAREVCDVPAAGQPPGSQSAHDGPPFLEVSPLRAAPRQQGAQAKGSPCPPVQDDDTARFPRAKLRSWVNARDVTCRAPGCTAPARSCDTDHTVDHADGGRTRHDNLGLLCRHHHRLKHEGGFRLTQPEPGQFHWTSPNGRTYAAAPEPP